MKDPFIFKVSELLKEVGAEVLLVFEGQPRFEEAPFDLSGNLELDLEITNTGLTLLVAGNISGKVVLICARCQKNFEAPFVLKIEEQFARQSELKSASEKKEVQLETDDFIFPISDEETIDLKELIRQNILMNLPLKPLCSPNCPEVGQNLLEKSDPRFGELKKIKKKLEGEK